MIIKVEIIVADPPPDYTEDEMFQDVKFALTARPLETESGYIVDVTQITRKLP